MVKHTQTILQQKPINSAAKADELFVFDDFVGLTFKGLTHCYRSVIFSKASHPYHHLRPLTSTFNVILFLNGNLVLTIKLNGEEKRQNTFKCKTSDVTATSFCFYSV